MSDAQSSELNSEEQPLRFYTGSEEMGPAQEAQPVK